MKVYIKLLLCIVLLTTTAYPVDTTSPSYLLYKKAMVNYYLYKKVRRAGRLLITSLRRDETFLAGYLAISRAYIKIGKSKFVKKVLDKAWGDCRKKSQRIELIIAKARLIHDVLHNRAKAYAFTKWASKKYKFRKLSILKKRYYLEKNVILKFPVIRRGRKSYDLNDKRYKNKKFFFLFWHPEIPRMKYVIYKWYKLAKRYGFIPVLFTPVNKKRAYSYFKSMSIKLNTFYSTSKQDISKIFGIDLVPHCYFLGRDKEVLYSGHPDHISKRILYKISRL